MPHREPALLMRRIRHATLIAAALLAAGAVAQAADSPPLSSSRYDTDYPTIPYSANATHNAFARLQARMDRGEVKLEYRPGRGYLDSLLKELKIDPSSQVMVYSKTSLQIDFINATTPRDVYFNDSTYV